MSNTERVAVALERIATRLEAMRTDVEEEDLDYLELQREKVEMTAARDTAIRERDEARRERDELIARCRKLEVVAFNGATITVNPLRWSPEPPKVAGLYLRKNKDSLDVDAMAGWYPRFARDVERNWNPWFVYCGPLVIAEPTEAGGGNE